MYYLYNSSTSPISREIGYTSIKLVLNYTCIIFILVPSRPLSPEEPVTPPPPSPTVPLKEPGNACSVVELLIHCSYAVSELVGGFSI